MIPKKRVLIVDDETGFSRILKLNLEETGHYEARTESSGLRALDAAREFRPHVVLMDIVLPDASGIAVASRMRRDDDLKDTPIIFITGTDVRAHADSAGRISGSPTIVKPAPLGEITREIRRTLGEVP